MRGLEGHNTKNIPKFSSSCIWYFWYIKEVGMQLGIHSTELAFTDPVAATRGTMPKSKAPCEIDNVWVIITLRMFYE